MKDGTCVLLHVELDSPSPDEPPRVTVRGATPLAKLGAHARMLLTLEITEEAGLAALEAELGEQRRLRLVSASSSGGQRVRRASTTTVHDMRGHGAQPTMSSGGVHHRDLYSLSLQVLPLASS